MNTENILKLIDLIKYPAVTEKSMKLLEKNQYSFILDSKIKKPQIKEVIEFLFDVKVEKVNTFYCALKTKTRRTKFGIAEGKKSQYKKAVVFLKKDYKIDFFDENKYLE